MHSYNEIQNIKTENTENMFRPLNLGFELATDIYNKNDPSAIKKLKSN